MNLAILSKMLKSIYLLNEFYIHDSSEKILHLRNILNARNHFLDNNNCFCDESCEEDDVLFHKNLFQWTKI